MKKIFLLVGLFAIASFFLDNAVFSLTQSMQNIYFAEFMSWLSNLWSIFFVLLVMTSLFMLEEKKARWLKVVWLSFLSSFILSVVFKEAFARSRPLEFAFGAGLLVYSFPSAHAAVAFSLIPVLDKEFKKLKPFWITFAVFVAVSRIYLGAHFLSDVVLGGILGYAVGKGFVWLEEKKMLRLSWKTTH
ncbi:MAG: phosphatase PAP2 family protein [Candidatus Woesearchaeota archaeon]